jgi:hypothetical protein
MLFKKEVSVNPWRTLAYQEVILRIGPLGKLGHFELTAEIFFVYIASISLASGPILSITSWLAKVLHGKSTCTKDVHKMLVKLTSRRRGRRKLIYFPSHNVPNKGRV